MASRWWAGVAAGVVLGLGALVAVEAATEDASAQARFRVTPGQLKINQRISQAAVRRSNQSLQLLDPIRAQRDQPTKPLGWRTQDLRDGAVSTAKIANGAVTEANLAGAVQSRLHTIYRAAVFATAGQTPALEPQSEGVTAVARTSGSTEGEFDVTFAQPVNGCTFSGSPATVRTTAPTPTPTPVVVWPTLLGTDQLRVVVLDEAGNAADAPFVVHVICN